MDIEEKSQDEKSQQREMSDDLDDDAICSNDDAFKILDEELPEHSDYHSKLVRNMYAPSAGLTVMQFRNFFVNTINMWKRQRSMMANLKNLGNTTNSNNNDDSINTNTRKWFNALSVEQGISTLGQSGWIWSCNRLSIFHGNMSMMKHNEWWMGSKDFIYRKFISKHPTMKNISFKKWILTAASILKLPSSKEALLKDQRAMHVLADPFKSMDLIGKVFQQVDELQLSGVSLRNNVSFHLFKKKKKKRTL